MSNKFFTIHKIGSRKRLSFSSSDRIRVDDKDYLPFQMQIQEMMLKGEFDKSFRISKIESFKDTLRNDDNLKLSIASAKGVDAHDLYHNNEFIKSAFNKAVKTAQDDYNKLLVDSLQNNIKQNINDNNNPA